MLSALEDVINNPHVPMPTHVREEIRKIANFRWKEMMEPAVTQMTNNPRKNVAVADGSEQGHPSKEVYLAGFVLDPRK